MNTSGTYLLLIIAGAAALLLWGIRMARTAVMRAHGSQLRQLLPGTLNNRVRALFTGLAAAAVLQSSTAVAVFIASLASQGVVPVAGGLAVMLGADVGSALVAALLTFNLKGAWPVLVLVGYAVHSTYERGNSRLKQHGRFLLGIGLVLIALTFMSQVSHVLAENNALKLLIGSLADDPALALLLLAGLTWLAHSSISILLLLSSLVEAGIIQTPAFLVAAVLGVNLGAGLPAVVLTWGQDQAARRICVGNSLFRCVGVAVGLVFLGRLEQLYNLLPGVQGLRVILLHIVFNTALAAAMLGFIPWFSRLLERLVPAPPTPEVEEFGPRYISPIPGALQAALPLSALSREALRMADVVQSMLSQTMAFLCTPNCAGERIRRLRQADDKVDTLYKAIRGYSIELSKSALPEPDLLRVSILLRYALNLENIGDIIDKSLLDITAQKNKARHNFSSDGTTELQYLFSFVEQSLSLSTDVIMAWRDETAADLVRRKKEFKVMARDSSERHIERLRLGVAVSLETSSYHLDIINDLQRIHSLIADLGEAVLEGEREKTDVQE